MSEFWAKDIVNARLKIKDGNIDEAIMILQCLLRSKSSDCIRESKKLLAQTLLQFQDKKEVAAQYLVELYDEKKNIELAINIMTLLAELGDIKRSKKYYEESIALIEAGTKFNATFVKYLYFASLVHSKSTFSEASFWVYNLIEDFKVIGVLDNHYLITRSLPSFYDFLKKVERLYLDNDKNNELVELLKEQLQWVDESGKKVVNEILAQNIK